MPTSVPPPTFGDHGFVAPSEADVLAGVQFDINRALGGGVNPGLSTPQGQIASTATAIIGDKNATFLWYTNQVDPALNSGRMQDAIGRIYFMTRIAGAPTVVAATCTGLPDVTIPVGALARADDGNLYVCQAQGVIPAGGSVVLPFACAVNGPTSCGTGTLNKIYQAVFGWDSITNLSDGVLGRNVESPSEFETRRARSVALNAVGIVDAIQSAVLAVPGVVDAFVMDNPRNTPFSVGGSTSGSGVLLGANSVYVAAIGGNPQLVAEAIWSRKPPGCSYNGNTTLTVTDPSLNYAFPRPSYEVTYEIPIPLNLAFLVRLLPDPRIPSNATQLVRTAIINAFSGADGGPRATIGSTVLASRYYAPIIALGPWVHIVEIELGVVGSGARFTASIAANVMTVTAVSEGTLDIGQLVVSSSIITNTIIIGFGTGTGGVGTYVISQAQVVNSIDMTSTVLLDQVTARIDQVPAVAAGDIYA